MHAFVFMLGIMAYIVAATVLATFILFLARTDWFRTWPDDSGEFPDGRWRLRQEHATKGRWLPKIPKKGEPVVR